MAFVDFLLFIIFPASLFTLFAAIIIGLAHDALRARAKGLLQAHQFKVINVQHAERGAMGCTPLSPPIMILKRCAKYVNLMYQQDLIVFSG